MKPSDAGFDGEKGILFTTPCPTYPEGLVYVLKRGKTLPSDETLSQKNQLLWYYPDGEDPKLLYVNKEGELYELDFHPIDSLLMTNHPIQPPAELVSLWVNMLETHNDSVVFTEVAQWGADQELGSCCEWLTKNCGRWELPLALRDDRRPKPPSLKEQALAAVEQLAKGYYGDPLNVGLVRKALEALPND